MTRRITGIVAIALLSACAPLYDVRPAPGNGGIPFHRMSAYCEQETVYLQELVVLTIDQPLPAPGQAQTIIQRTFVLDSAAHASMDRIRQAVRTNDLPGVQTEVSGLPSVDPAAGLPPQGLVLVSNGVRLKPFVDYATTYYYNVRRGWTGTTSATAKLSPEGLLTEGRAEVDDKTLETVAGLLPVKESLTSRWVADVRTTDAKSVPLRMTAESRWVRHTYTRRVEGDGGPGPAWNGTCATPARIEPTDPKAGYRREAVTAGDAKTP